MDHSLTGAARCLAVRFPVSNQRRSWGSRTSALRAKIWLGRNCCGAGRAAGDRGRGCAFGDHALQLGMGIAAGERLRAGPSQRGRSGGAVQQHHGRGNGVMTTKDPISELVGAPLSQNQLTVVMRMIKEIGVDAVRRSKFLHDLNAGLYGAAGMELVRAGRLVDYASWQV